MDFEQILSLIKTVSDSHLTRFSLEQGELKISMKTDKAAKMQPMAAPLQSREVMTAPVMPQTQPMPAAEEAKEAEVIAGNVIKAPLVGTFYSSSSPDAPAFVAVGDQVKAGQVLGIVEAMKLMNEIESEYTGTVTKILVENEQVVEYGQPLFVIESIG